jgi:hypothetical protein
MKPEDVQRLAEEVKRKFPPTERYLAEGHLVEAAVFRLAVKEVQPGFDDNYHRRLVEEIRNLDRESRAADLSSTATDRLLGKALVRALAPKIEDLRETGFGSPAPPFKTAAKAAEWVERQSKADLAEWSEGSEGRKKARAEIYRLAHEHRIEIEERATQLPYQRPGDEHVKWVYAAPGTYLYRLAQETVLLADRTGLSADALVMYVLTGLEPVRSRARLTTRENWYTLPTGEEIGVNEATVTFRARDLTDKELRSLYSMVRSGVSGKGTKGVGDKEVELWEMVQNLGGPPKEHGSKRNFWRTVQERWNRDHANGRYATWEGVKKRYESISARLRPPRR